MNRIDRLFGILTLLQSKKYVSAEAIAERFGISVRTVYRDVKALGEQGVPVSFEPHRGYFVVQGYFLPPVSFNSDEANALLLVESLVRGFSDQSIQAHYASALGKVKAVLRTTQKDKLDALNDTIKLQLPACFRHEFDHLSVLQQTISARTIITIEYCNHQGEASERPVEPIGLIFYALNWHLIAWCHHRSEYRDFRVSRIRRVQCTGRPFLKTDHISIGDYMQRLPVAY